MPTHGSQQIDQLCRKHWGELSGPSADELREQIEKLSTVIAASSGNSHGMLAHHIIEVRGLVERARATILAAWRAG